MKPGRKRHRNADMVIASYAGGCSAKWLSAQYGMSAWSVLRYVKQAGVARRSGPPLVGHPGIERALQAGRAESMAEIARDYGVSRAYVSQIAQRIGVKRYSRSGRSRK